MKATVKVNVVMQGEQLVHPASFQVSGEFVMTDVVPRVEGTVEMQDANVLDTRALEMERQAKSLKHAIEEAFHRLGIKPPAIVVTPEPAKV